MRSARGMQTARARRALTENRNSIRCAKPEEQRSLMRRHISAFRGNAAIRSLMVHSGPRQPTTRQIYGFTA